MAEATVKLTDEQVVFYHREGYLVLPSISTPPEIARVREIYDRLFAQRAGRDEGSQFDLAGTDEEGKEATLPQILGPSRYAPELAEGVFRANALAIARQLLGPQAEGMGEHAILKPARIGAATPWHQDEAYWGPELNYNSFSLWMPLQAATLDNGCMEFVPRSHLWDVLPHHSIGHDPRVHGLEVEGADVSTAVACPIPAGGCTIHSNRTLHYAGPNRSDQPRRAYILSMGIKPTRRTIARRFPWNDLKRTARDERARAAQARPTQPKPAEA
jgi:ectoine hydroxylase-related dioxygenase (phytanoyl-CoA dioxygenase family)